MSKTFAKPSNAPAISSRPFASSGAELFAESSAFVSSGNSFSASRANGGNRSTTFGSSSANCGINGTSASTSFGSSGASACTAVSSACPSASATGSTTGANASNALPSASPSVAAISPKIGDSFTIAFANESISGDSPFSADVKPCPSPAINGSSAGASFSNAFATIVSACPKTGPIVDARFPTAGPSAANASPSAGSAVITPATPSRRPRKNSVSPAWNAGPFTICAIRSNAGPSANIPVAAPSADAVAARIRPARIDPVDDAT